MLQVLFWYLSISSTNNLSDIGKAKLNSTLLSSSKVTKPSPRLSNATKARHMFPWFSIIYNRNVKFRIHFVYHKLNFILLFTVLSAQWSDIAIGNLVSLKLTSFINFISIYFYIYRYILIDVCECHWYPWYQTLKAVWYNAEKKTSRKAVLTTHRSQKITFCLSLCSSSVNVKIGGLCFLSWLDLGLLLTAASFTSCWPSPWPAKRVRNLNMHRCVVVYEIYQKIVIDLQEESTRKPFAFTCTCKYQLRPSITSFCPC